MNNPEFMCRIVELISDFDNINHFSVGNNDILDDNQVQLMPIAKVASGGIGNSNCMELKTPEFPDQGGTYFV